jgi:glycosyltransferase involved in cell wall biosynthesis
MKILQLCHKPPYPPIDGGTKAMYYLTKGLIEHGHDVKVLCISTPKHPLDLTTVPPDLRKKTQLEGVFVDTSMNIVDMFTDLITMDNYNISRFFSPDLDIRLIQLLSSTAFDVIHLESLFMTPYIQNIRRYSKAPIVLRSHNQEHVIQERLAKNEKNIILKPYRKFLAKQLKEHEINVLDRVDGVAAISDSDAQKFRQYNRSIPICTIPFGVDLNDYPIESTSVKNSPMFFHLGSMDWQPNDEGIRWLLSKVWPRVIGKYPKARLVLAGNKMPEDLLKADIEGVKVKGRVRNAQKFMRSGDVMLVPLFSAGGMRIKIVEGMALGKTIISTAIGAEGVDYTDGKNILIAKGVHEFVQHIGSLIEQPENCANIGAEARKLISSKYDHEIIVNSLLTFYSSLIK